MKWFLVFIGSGIGGCFRLLTAEIAAKYLSRSFPYATFLSNLLACLLLGFILGFFDGVKLLDGRIRLFLGIGICGGFSTFSTFSNEALQLLSAQKFTLAALYIVSSFFLGILAVYAGFSAVSQFK